MRRQLALVMLASASLLLVAFVLPLSLLVRTFAESQAVTAAQQDTQSLAAVVAGAGESDLALVVQQLQERSARRVTVVLPDGRQLGQPVEPGPSLALARAGQAFTSRLPDGLELVAPVDTPAGTVVIRSFVPTDELHRGVPRAVAVLVGLGLVLLALSVALADRLAQGVVRPLSDLAATASRLEDGDLSARPRVGGPPEVVEVGRALDRLAGRITGFLQAEREGIADLSHRLRTPLTAMRLDAEGLSDPQESARMQAHAETLQAVVTQVIDEARRGVDEPEAAVCDAAAVAAERAAFWSALAEDQGRPVRLDLDDRPVSVALSAADLGAALDVLLGNVFTHTPDGTGFTLRARAAPGGRCRVAVEDDGPGLPDLAVLERGRSGGGSTGLGLDIARRLAEGTGGRLALGRSSLGGAEVEVLLRTGEPEEAPRRRRRPAAGDGDLLGRARKLVSDARSSLGSGGRSRT